MALARRGGQRRRRRSGRAWPPPSTTAVLDHRSRGAGADRVHPVPVDNLLTMLLNELAGTTVETWLVLDDYHLVDNRDIDRRGRLPPGPPPPARPRRHQYAGRPRPAPVAVAGTRRAGRGSRRGPPLHSRRGGRIPQRRGGSRAHRGAGHRPRAAHRGMDRRSPARGAVAARARGRRRSSSPGSTGTTATSSTTWWTRCSTTSPRPFDASWPGRRCSTASPVPCATR